jgi:hypothetical protein
MELTSVNQTAERTPPMTTNPFDALLASGRAFSMTLPDGTRVDVPPADVKSNVNSHADVNTNVNTDVNAPENVNTDVNNDVNSHDVNVNADVNTEAQMAPTPEPAPADADVKNADVKNVKSHVNVKSDVNVNETDELPKSLQAVLDLFGDGEALSNTDIAERLHIKATAACNRVRRLVVLERLHAGGEKGKYFVNLPPENAVGVHMTVPCEDVNSPDGVNDTGSNREERTEPSNYSKSNTYGKSLISNATVIGSYRANQSVPEDQSQELRSDRSAEHPHSPASSIPPAPATSPKPPDLDDLDEDERDALEAEEFAASGHTPIRLNLPKRTQPHPRYTPPPPKRRPYVPAYAPVVVEDDFEDEGWDPPD